jgi:hypothetical protein
VRKIQQQQQQCSIHATLSQWIEGSDMYITETNIIFALERAEADPDWARIVIQPVIT